MVKLEYILNRLRLANEKIQNLNFQESGVFNQNEDNIIKYITIYFVDAIYNNNVLKTDFDYKNRRTSYEVEKELTLPIINKILPIFSDFKILFYDKYNLHSFVPTYRKYCLKHTGIGWYSDENCENQLRIFLENIVDVNYYYNSFPYSQEILSKVQKAVNELTSFMYCLQKQMNDDEFHNKFIEQFFDINTKLYGDLTYPTKHNCWDYVRLYNVYGAYYNQPLASLYLDLPQLNYDKQQFDKLKHSVQNVFDDICLFVEEYQSINGEDILQEGIEPKEKNDKDLYKIPNGSIELDEHIFLYLGGDNFKDTSKGLYMLVNSNQSEKYSSLSPLCIKIIKFFYDTKNQKKHMSLKDLGEKWCKELADKNGKRSTISNAVKKINDICDKSGVKQIILSDVDTKKYLNPDLSCMKAL